LVIIHLFEAIIRIADHVVLPTQLDALRHEFATTCAAAERGCSSQADRTDIRDRALKVDAAFQRAAARLCSSGESDDLVLRK
jgi:uncharacterized membrane protein